MTTSTTRRTSTQAQDMADAADAAHRAVQPSVPARAREKREVADTVSVIRRLKRDKATLMDSVTVNALEAVVNNGLDLSQADNILTWLINLKPETQAPADDPRPVRRGQSRTPDVQPGIYRHDGSLYVVRHNQDQTRTYALLINTDKKRLEFERGAIFDLLPTERVKPNDPEVKALRAASKYLGRQFDAIA